MKKQNDDKSSEENKKNPNVSIHVTMVKINFENDSNSSYINGNENYNNDVIVQSNDNTSIDRQFIHNYPKEETNVPKVEENKPEDINTNTKQFEKYDDSQQPSNNRNKADENEIMEEEDFFTPKNNDIDSKKEKGKIINI